VKVIPATENLRIRYSVFADVDVNVGFLTSHYFASLAKAASRHSRLLSIRPRQCSVEEFGKKYCTVVGK